MTTSIPSRLEVGSLTIGSCHMNDHGRVDAVSIQRALPAFQSNYLYSVIGRNFEQLLNEGLTPKITHVETLQLSSAELQLNDKCRVKTSITIQGFKLKFEQIVENEKGQGLFLAHFTVCFLTNEGYPEYAIARRIGQILS